MFARKGAASHGEEVTPKVFVGLHSELRDLISDAHLKHFGNVMC